MATKHLTVRENEIMEIFWHSDKPLSANDVYNAQPELSKNTIQAVLRKLLKMNYLEVAGIGYNKNSLTREFKASISQSQYFSNFLVESESFQLACQFVKKTKDTKSLEELENLIQERIKKLS